MKTFRDRLRGFGQGFWQNNSCDQRKGERYESSESWINRWPEIVNSGKFMISRKNRLISNKSKIPVSFSGLE